MVGEHGNRILGP